MADITSLIAKVRFELGDLGTSFVVPFQADGTTNRFHLHYHPLDGTSVKVFTGTTDLTQYAAVEESTGVLVLELPVSLANVSDANGLPVAGLPLVVSGTYFRYFTTGEMTTLVNNAATQHMANHTDALGRQLTLANLPLIEEFPVAVYATSLALYTLATDSSFDIDISAPDGVSIPRSERYHQLLQMIEVRKAQYQELCVQLGIGLFAIEVFTLRRVSKTTNRYVPVYTPQEVDDRSYPHRVQDAVPTYGNKPVPWITEGLELTCQQGRAFTADVPFTGSFTGASFIANVLTQRGSIQTVKPFTLSVLDNGGGNYVATISLDEDTTEYLSEKTWYSISALTTDSTTGEFVEIVGGNFFTQRSYQVIL